LLDYIRSSAYALPGVAELSNNRRDRPRAGSVSVN